jgi:hypothetical protein
MNSKYILYSCIINYVTSGIPTSIYQKINDETPNIYTIQSNNFPIKNISEYSNSDLDIYQLKLDTNMNMFSLFTKNYFSKCDKIDDPNCLYNLTDQESACKQYLDDHQNNNTYKMYYYGVFNTYKYTKLNYVISHDQVKSINYNIKYETIGVYVIENINNTQIEINQFRLNFNLLEPDDFYRQMMLYLVPGIQKTTFCPYWIIRNF